MAGSIMTEAAVTAVVVAEMRRMGWESIRNTQVRLGRKRTIEGSVYAQLLPVPDLERGVPDWTFVHRALPVCMIEVKGSAGVLSIEQRGFIAAHGRVAFAIGQHCQTDVQIVAALHAELQRRGLLTPPPPPVVIYG